MGWSPPCYQGDEILIRAPREAPGRPRDTGGMSFGRRPKYQPPPKEKGCTSSKEMWDPFDRFQPHLSRAFPSLYFSGPILITAFPRGSAAPGGTLSAPKMGSRGLSMMVVVVILRFTRRCDDGHPPPPPPPRPQKWRGDRRFKRSARGGWVNKWTAARRQKKRRG